MTHADASSGSRNRAGARPTTTFEAGDGPVPALLQTGTAGRSRSGATPLHAAPSVRRVRWQHTLRASRPRLARNSRPSRDGNHDVTTTMRRQSARVTEETILDVVLEDEEDDVETPRRPATPRAGYASAPPWLESLREETKVKARRSVSSCIGCEDAVDAAWKIIGIYPVGRLRTHTEDAGRRGRVRRAARRRRVFRCRLVAPSRSHHLVEMGAPRKVACIRAGVVAAARDRACCAARPGAVGPARRCVRGGISSGPRHAPALVGPTICSPHSAAAEFKTIAATPGFANLVSQVSAWSCSRRSWATGSASR